MSSYSQYESAISYFVTINYATVIVLSIVGYDYILTFSREVGYVWCQPWSWVSAMFVFIRYLGLYWATVNALTPSTFITGATVEVCFSASFFCLCLVFVRRTMLYLTGSIWSFVVFLSIADLMMILRVYAMWNRSKAILIVLLLIFVTQTVLGLVFAGLYINPATNLSVTVVQVLDFTACGIVLDASSTLSLCFLIPRFALSAMLLVLTITQTVKESVGMYRATHQWQPNRYLKLLVQHGIIYFFTSLLFNVMEAIISGTTFDINNPLVLFPTMFSYFAFATIMPRFIISVREMYIHATCCQGQGIDTGFGMLSPSQRCAVSTMAFAGDHLGQSQTTDNSDEMIGRQGDDGTHAV